MVVDLGIEDFSTTTIFLMIFGLVVMSFGGGALAAFILDEDRKKKGTPAPVSSLGAGHSGWLRRLVALQRQSSTLCWPALSCKLRKRGEGKETSLVDRSLAERRGFLVRISAVYRRHPLFLCLGRVDCGVSEAPVASWRARPRAPCGPPQCSTLTRTAPAVDGRGLRRTRIYDVTVSCRGELRWSARRRPAGPLGPAPQLLVW